jgi:hypothetical protein
VLLNQSESMSQYLNLTIAWQDYYLQRLKVDWYFEYRWP